MSLETHVAALNGKHAEIDATITRERQRPSPDTLRLHALKKQKLLLKQKINRTNSQN